MTGITLEVEVYRRICHLAWLALLAARAGTQDDTNDTLADVTSFEEEELQPGDLPSLQALHLPGSELLAFVELEREGGPPIGS